MALAPSALSAAAHHASVLHGQVGVPTLPSKCKWMTGTTLAAIVTLVALCALTGLVASPLLALGVSVTAFSMAAGWTIAIATTACVALGIVKYEKARRDYLPNLLKDFAHYIKSDEPKALKRAAISFRTALIFHSARALGFASKINRPLTPQMEEILKNDHPILLARLKINHLKLRLEVLTDEAFIKEAADMLIGRPFFGFSEMWLSFPLAFAIEERGIIFEFIRYIIKSRPAYTPELIQFLCELPIGEDKKNHWNQIDPETGRPLFGLAAGYGAMNLVKEVLQHMSKQDQLIASMILPSPEGEGVSDTAKSGFEENRINSIRLQLDAGANVTINMALGYV